MGDLENLTTAEKSTIVGAINEVDTNVGPVEELTTTNKIVTYAINELDSEMGDLSKLHTEAKDNMVNALNEVHDDLGTIEELTTDDKSTAVAGINELDKRVGKLPELKQQISQVLLMLLMDLVILVSLRPLQKKPLLRQLMN